jgi:hypothetical protein
MSENLTAVGIGDIYLFRAPVENPYQWFENTKKEIDWDDRKASFAHFNANGTFPDEVVEIWYAPCSGGAKRVKKAHRRNGSHIDAEFET